MDTIYLQNQYMKLLNPNNHLKAAESQNANANHLDPNIQNDKSICQYSHTQQEYSLLIHINHQRVVYLLKNILLLPITFPILYHQQADPY
mgnify:CR=1 FL=1